MSTSTAAPRSSLRGRRQQACRTSRTPRMPRTPRTLGAEDGSIAVMFSLLVIPLIALCGLVIDLAVVYNRQAESYSVASAIAISAAARLNGTASGIDDALSDAASNAATLKYKNFNVALRWSADALRFGTSPDRAAAWSDGGSAAVNANGVYYVKVDTRALTNFGTVNTALMRIFSPAFKSVAVSSEVVAGRTGIAVTPLAICAMSTSAASSRANSPAYPELVQYGFRRGVSYNLMNLNPSASTPAHFVINPLARPGESGDAAGLSTATVGPYTCSGTLAIPAVTGGAISVGAPFPLASLYRQLNSRFDQYDGAVCTANAAPPDANIKSYEYGAMVSPLEWMTQAPGGQSAAVAPTTGKLETIADLPPPGGSAAQYGPLWAYAQAVSYASYSASPLEPVEGYATMPVAAWPTLYGGQVARSKYPATTPYLAEAGINYAAPSAAHGGGVKHRRVLNVPLLDCAASSGAGATVLAVGKFFMTVPATPSVLAAEFAGTLPFERIPASVGLF